MIDVVGVRFKNSSKTYYFDPVGLEFSIGEYVIVETARGIEYAEINKEKTVISNEDLKTPLKPILRKATVEDSKSFEKNQRDAVEALDVCIEKAKSRKLNMNLIECEYTFDRAKLIFYFTADGRIDFRELVRDLAAIFRTRIELRQVGVRDKARHLGGYGVCGREYCCKGWMSRFQPVTVKMAKDQGLSLNPSKISGACGRLFCCLKFEHENYEGLLKVMPSVGSIVSTPDGNGKVVSTQTLLKQVKILFDDEAGNVFKEYPLEDIKVLKVYYQKDENVEMDASYEELSGLED